MTAARVDCHNIRHSNRLQDRNSLCKGYSVRCPLATGASRPRWWLTQPLQMAEAVRIVWEPSHEILPPSRVVHATYRVLGHPGGLPCKGSEGHTPLIGI